VIASGTPDELKSQSGRDVIEVRPREAGDLPVVEEILATVAAEPPRTDLDTQRCTASVDGGAEHLTTVVRMLDERGISSDDIGLRRPTLDEVFIALTGHPVDDAPDPDASADAA
jgi:ABC-2 type transport system ATP-binding protein